MRCPLFALFLLAAAYSSPALCSGQERPPGRDAPWNGAGPEKVAPPVIERLGDGIVRIDTITVSKRQGTVTMPGVVNMDEQDPVEYLACGPRGKLHECILRVDVIPSYLQIALLLLGLEPGDQPLSRQGADETPTGDPVEIWISWTGEDGSEQKHRAEELHFNLATGGTMLKTHWIFTGSRILEGRFMADVEQSVAATYHDPYAMLDHPLPTGADDTLYTVNTDLLPPRGTPITMTIRSLKE